MASNDDFFRKQWLSEVPPFVPLFFDWRIRPDVDHYRRCYKDQLCPTIQQQLHEQQTKEAMTKFKKGDRVRVTSVGSQYQGCEGVVTDVQLYNRYEVGLDGVGLLNYSVSCLELVDQPISTTPDKVLQAAKTSPQAKDALKALFPDVFKDEPYEFGSGYLIGRDHNGPIFIGNSYAPADELRGKCLMVDNSKWRMKTVGRGAFTILTFHKKS